MIYFMMLVYVTNVMISCACCKKIVNKIIRFYELEDRVVQMCYNLRERPDL